jgi:DNA-binding NtrC family response regulator
MALRVLAIDDDPLTLRILEVFLTSKGADVVTSDFPEDVAELIRQAHPDVLLLDLMSATDSLAGVIILGRLYGSGQKALQLPVLLMSIDHEWLSALAPSLHQLGAGVVSKPFDLDHLWQTIEQAVSAYPLRGRPGG